MRAFAHGIGPRSAPAIALLLAVLAACPSPSDPTRPRPEGQAGAGGEGGVGSSGGIGGLGGDLPGGGAEGGGNGGESGTGGFGGAGGAGGTPLPPRCHLQGGPCLPEEAACAGRCVHLARDPAHCGDCARACAEQEVCREGACQPGCAAFGLDLAAVHLPLPGASAFALADLDGDARLDLLVAVPGQSGLDFLRGKDGRSFDAPVRTEVPGSVQSLLFAADLDADGAPEIVAYGRDRGAIAVLRNEGDGTFSPWVEVVAANVQKLAIADWDGDGRSDLLGIDMEGVFWMAGTEEGFGPRQALLSGDHWRAFDVADLDGDGALDLAAVSLQRKALALAWGSGGGGAALEGYALERGPLDLAMETGVAPGLRLVLGDGPGALGRMDLGAERSLGPLVELAPSRAIELRRSAWRTGTFFGRGPANAVYLGTDGLQREFAFASSVHQVEEGDLDGDGVPDLVVRADDGIALLHGRTSQDFVRGADLGLAAPVVATLPADLDRDGVRDAVLVLRGSAPRIWSGATGAVRAVGEGEDFVFAAADATLADLDADGHLDLIVAEAAPDGRLAVLLGDGAGGFGPPMRTPTGALFRIVAADLDGDGSLDVAATLDSGSGLLRLRGTGDGNLIPDWELPLPGNTAGIATLDFNEDGRVDLAVALYGESAVQLLANDGHGRFLPCQILPVAEGPVALRAADLDGDGRQDLVAAAYGGRATSLLLRTADGGWERRDLPAPRPVWSAIPLDLRGAAASLLVLDEFGQGEIWVPAGDAWVREGRHDAPERELLSAAVVDLDGDGSLDLLAGTAQGARFVYGRCISSD